MAREKIKMCKLKLVYYEKIDHLKTKCDNSGTEVRDFLKVNCNVGMYWGSGLYPSHNVRHRFKLRPPGFMLRCFATLCCPYVVRFLLPSSPYSSDNRVLVKSKHA